MMRGRSAMDRKACPVCRVDLRHAGWTVTEPQVGGQPIEVLRCPACGLVTTPWQFESEEELTAIYAQYSYHSETAWEVPTATWHSLRSWVRRMEPFRRANRWLDVGCGAGALLRVAAEQGWRVQGTELSTLAADRLRAEGFTVHVGFLGLLNIPPETFDVVTMIELIEHLPDPMGDLRTVHRLLRPGGALFLTTPNAGSLHCRWFGFRDTLGPPGHLWGFTTRAVRKMLYQTGFRPLRVWTDGLNPYRILRRIRAAGPQGSSDVWRQTQDLRERAVRNPAWRAAKFSVNVLMRMSGLGDTLKAIAVKPEA